MPKNGAREAESGQLDGVTTGVSGVTAWSNLSDGVAAPYRFSCALLQRPSRKGICNVTLRGTTYFLHNLYSFCFCSHRALVGGPSERSVRRAGSQAREKGLFSSVYLLPPQRSQKSLLLIVCIDCLPSLGCL
ncbi:unnamed protein product [Boreogadus saida]